MLRQKDGLALAVVLIITAALSILGVGILSVSLGETKQVAYQDNMMQAYYLARSGADAISRYILCNPLEADNLLAAPASNDNTHFSNGTFTVDVKPGNATNELFVESTGTVKDVSSKISVLMSRMDPQLIIDKAIYSNSSLDISGMVVNGDVQAAGTIQYKNNGKHAFYDTPYPNSPRTIELKAFPTVHSLHSPADLVVDNDTIEINPPFDNLKVKKALKPIPIRGFGGLLICQENLAQFSYF